MRQPKSVFEIGQQVRWRSQAGGYAKEKRGEIILVIPAGSPLPKSVVHAPKSKCHNPGGPRDHESYVVRTVDGRLYWPRTDRLELDL